MLSPNPLYLFCVYPALQPSGNCVKHHSFIRLYHEWIFTYWWAWSGSSFFIHHIGNKLHLCIWAFTAHVLLTDVSSSIRSIDVVYYSFMKKNKWRHQRSFPTYHRLSIMVCPHSSVSSFQDFRTNRNIPDWCTISFSWETWSFRFLNPCPSVLSAASGCPQPRYCLLWLSKYAQVSSSL